MDEATFLEWERHRDIGQEILDGIVEIKAGKTGRHFTADSFPYIRIREKMALSQAEFAKMLGVSLRTLQDWEQGRRTPSGAAKTLLKVAEHHPDILRNLAA